MSIAKIVATELSTFDVDPEGEHVRLHMRNEDGQPASLILPARCLHQLLMTIPRMVETALRNRHGDDSLRLVHALEEFALEVGEADAHGVQQFVLSVQTRGGFAVSFSAPQTSLDTLARTILEELPAECQDQEMRLRLS